MGLFVVLHVWETCNDWKCSTSIEILTKSDTTAMAFHLCPDEVLRLGLSLVGFDAKRQQRTAPGTNLTRFRTAYGASPDGYSKIMTDLQTTRCRCVTGNSSFREPRRRSDHSRNLRMIHLKQRSKV